ncbi:MAG TPA: hypothetical protein VEC96_13900 [Anaerolineae bacterium]|nr:hypothetical protein [Anaerolineae bacterium]
MKFRITGAYVLYICNTDQEITGAYLDHIVDASNADHAADKALQQALGQYPASGDPECHNRAWWDGWPEIIELPADQENLLLPPDVAPRLPGF